jgi:hypothetical protein
VVTLIHGHDVAGAPSKADVEHAMVDYEVPFDRNVRKASWPASRSCANSGLAQQLARRLMCSPSLLSRWTRSVAASSTCWLAQACSRKCEDVAVKRGTSSEALN